MLPLRRVQRTDLVLLALLAIDASGQVVQLSAGASTLYGAQGGAVTIHGDKMETSFGAGLIQHHFAAGGSSVRSISGGSLTAGQQELRMDLPTDVFERDHILFGLGLGLREQLKSRGHLTLFAGSSSEEGGTPLFETASTHGRAAFGDWRMPLSRHCVAEGMGALAQARLLLGSVECALSPGVQVAATSGVGGSAGYGAASVQVKQRRFDLKAAYIDAGVRFERGDDGGIPVPEPIGGNVSAEFRPSRSLTISALHRNYLTPAPVLSPPTALTQPLRSSLDQVSLAFHRRSSGLQFSLLHSTASQTELTSPAASRNGDVALTVGWSDTFGRLQWTENWMHARETGMGSTSLLVNGWSYDVNPHLNLTEDINVSGQDVTFSHGGTWLTSFSSVAVDYQLLYVANHPVHPFQETMVFDIGTRLFHGLSVHAASSVGPTGAVLYTFQLGKVFAHSAAAAQMLSTDIGGYSLQGRVVDGAGRPIEGAALLIGDEHVYTDSAGGFLYRESRRHTHPFRVLTDQFLCIGQYEVVSAPSEASTTRGEGASLTIVVAERGEPRSTAMGVKIAQVMAPSSSTGASQ